MQPWKRTGVWDVELLLAKPGKELCGKVVKVGFCIEKEVTFEDMKTCIQVVLLQLEQINAAVLENWAGV